MKIAVNTRFLLPDKLEGIGVVKHEILQRLTVQYPEHQFYFFFDRPYDKRFIYADNITPIVLFPPARHPFLFYIWFEFSVARALKKIKPDVFLSLDTFSTLNTTVPRVTMFLDLAFEHYPSDVSYLDLKYYQYFFPKFARAAAKILSISTFTKQDLIERYHIPADKIDIVYCASSDRFKPIAFSEQVKVRQKFTGGEAYFIFVGAIQPRKNLVNMFRAFDLFKKKTGSEVKLLIVGRKAWKSEPITNAYEQLDFKDDVIFTGRISDAELVSVYGAALATLFISTLEGFGLPIIEAQRCDCPVITSNTSSMPEVAGEAAILVDPFNIEEITQAMITVYHQLEVRAQLIKAGKENYKRFSWDNSARQVMQVLEEVVKTSR